MRKQGGNWISLNFEWFLIILIAYSRSSAYLKLSFICSKFGNHTTRASLFFCLLLRVLSILTCIFLKIVNVRWQRKPILLWYYFEEENISDFINHQKLHKKSYCLLSTNQKQLKEPLGKYSKRTAVRTSIGEKLQNFHWRAKEQGE